MTEPDRYAPVYVLPVCSWCRHLWVAHRGDAGCRAPVGRGRVCGCREPPPDDPDGGGQEHDEHGQEEQAA
ncbi:MULTISPECIES: hypothetical protein [Protofrankia]|uniref:Uncharacterized protein n=1 Tax=Protofrankia coriariae TaxID=1562887 RepID=A0ABR5F2G0_9ACTN|nr:MULTISPECIES: hypothetical protein [Protofrankia]KLL10833.1 hypothetical protein FrCorBMG51_15610 [Protofrankia coriariae]ONH34039.1 hypothetical protein BL254_18570 [Protofrankia sp. BMG5.30]